MFVIDKFLHVKDEVMQWIIDMNDIHLMLYVLLLTTCLFLILHGQRNKPILKNISIYFGFIPVLVHELGHAVTARLTGGRVNNINMILTHRGQVKNGAQGYAETIPRGRVSAILTTFMGYANPPLMFFLGIYLIEKQMSVLFILVLVLFSLFYLVHTRQIFVPLIMLAILLYSGYMLSLRSSGFISVSFDVIYNVILGLLLGEIIQSILITGQIILRGEVKQWDGKALARLTFIPAFIWFFVWCALDIFLIYKSFVMIF